MNNEFSIFDTRVGRDRRFRLSRTQSQNGLPGYGQRCQVRDFIPRSRDFLKQLGFLFLKVNLGIFWGFFEKGKFEILKFI
jgi:hypothetical protein